MDERTILKAQIALLEQQLDRAKAALNLPAIGDELRKRVNNLFEEQFAKHLQDLRSLRNLVAGGLPLAACWSSFQETRKACRPLFEECLALIEGALVRGSKADDGLCQIADALLDDLSSRADIPWGRFTILAEKEFYGDMAQVIRLRFPEVSIWNLPVAAHEFGHFVGPQLKKRSVSGIYSYPFQDALESAEQQGQDEKQGKQRWFHLHEHFADVFATHALGIAFAGMCMLLRFNPADAYTDSEQHPSHAKRLYVIDKALQKMNLGAYQNFIKNLQATWQQSLKAAGSPEHLEPGETLQLDMLVDQLYTIAATKLEHIQYHDFLRADALSEDLLTNKETAHIVEPGYSVADALNAAWICRIEHKIEDNNQLSRIETRTRMVCLEILRQRGSFQ